jgi:hypothetical protein
VDRIGVGRRADLHDSLHDRLVETVRTLAEPRHLDPIIQEVVVVALTVLVADVHK